MFVAPLAIDLTVILACLVALGLILVAKSFALALATIIKHSVGHLPIVGRFFGSASDWIEKQIVSAMSDVANGVEGIIGAFWHALGNVISSVGHEIVGLAVAVDQFGQYLHSVVRPWVVHAVTQGLLHGVKWLKHEAASLKTTVYRVTKVIEHPEHTAIGGAVRTITRPISSSLAHLERWTRAQVATLTHDVTIWLPGELHRLRGEVNVIGRTLRHLRAWARKHERALSIGALTGAVTWVIARTGAGWIFCRNWNKVGRNVCRMDVNALESLLAGTLAIVGTISIVEFAKELQAIVGEGESAIHGLIREK